MSNLFVAVVVIGSISSTALLVWKTKEEVAKWEKLIDLSRSNIEKTKIADLLIILDSSSNDLKGVERARTLNPDLDIIILDHHEFDSKEIMDEMDKEVILCFDNDASGAEGMVKVLKLIPTAKVVLIPVRPNIKDLTDYVQYGGNIHELLKTAKHYDSISTVKDDMAARVSGLS